MLWINFINVRLEFAMYVKKSLKIPEGREAVNRRRTNNTMTKRTNNNVQNTSQKIYNKRTNNNV